MATELAANSPRAGVERLVLIAPIGLWLDEHPIPDIGGDPAESAARAGPGRPRGPLAAMLRRRPDDPEALFRAA